MVELSPWFVSRDDDDGRRAARVAFASARMIDGRRPEQAFADLVELGIDRREAAVAVCVAVGTPWEAAEARMAGFDSIWASLSAGSADIAGGLLELYGYFDQEVALNPEQNRIASDLQQAMAAVEFMPTGYANQMHRLLRTGGLREAFLSLAEMGNLRWPENGPFWQHMLDAAHGLDPLDDEIALTRRRCEQFVRG